MGGEDRPTHLFPTRAILPVLVLDPLQSVRPRDPHLLFSLFGRIADMLDDRRPRIRRRSASSPLEGKIPAPIEGVHWRWNSMD